MLFARIIRKLKFAAFAALACLSLPAVAKNSAIAVRTGIQPDGATRVVIETSQRPDYRISYLDAHLDAPARIIVDLAGTTAGSLQQNGAFVGHVKDVRPSEMEGSVRLVIDLSEYAESRRDFVLNPIDGYKNFRLVLDTAKVPAGRFAALAGTPAATPAQAGTQEVPAPVVKPNPTPAPTAPPPAPSPKPPTNEAQRKRVIVIDAGHGGTDPGTIGPGGTKEKDIVLEVALELERILSRNPGYTVFMTRRTDIFLPLQKRSAIAEQHSASLFISVHADSSPRKAAKGFSIYTLNEKATDEESKKLAEKENAADLLGISAFSQYDAITKNILGDLLQTEVIRVSNEFAEEIVMHVKRNLSVVEQPHRQAPFVVLRSAVPSVLVEVGFLSNPDEEKLLRSREHRVRIAASISTAVDKILNK